MSSKPGALRVYDQPSTEYNFALIKCMLNALFCLVSGLIVAQHVILCTMSIVTFHIHTSYLGMQNGLSICLTPPRQ